MTSSFEDRYDARIAEAMLAQASNFHGGLTCTNSDRVVATALGTIAITPPKPKSQGEG